MNDEQELHAAMAEMFATSRLLVGQLRTRIMIGGVFGSGEFTLASTSLIENGLHSVRYFVLHSVTGCPISIAATKDGAIAMARRSLEGPARERLIRCVLLVHSDFVAAEAARMAAVKQEAHDCIRAAKNKSPRIAHIPKRRREIFDASEGKCHYCATPLTLDGRWHIEHKMPKALMGGNEPSNLVASCAPCNHKKRDLTAEEFIARRSQSA